VSFECPVLTFLTETMALGTALPEESVMVPVTVTPGLCARNGGEFRRRNPRMTAMSSSAGARSFIRDPPLDSADLGTLRVYACKAFSQGYCLAFVSSDEE
jgi:hypothetical protein